MNNKSNYSSPRIVVVEIGPEAVIANSYKDGGDAFSIVYWHNESDDNLKW